MRELELSVGQGATGKFFGGRKYMLHSVFFQLHRAKEILYKKKGEIIWVKNTVPVIVNYSWKSIKIELTSLFLEAHFKGNFRNSELCVFFSIFKCNLCGWVAIVMIIHFIFFWPQMIEMNKCRLQNSINFSYVLVSELKRTAFWI